LALNNIISRNFPGINVFNVSLVEDNEPKDYHNRFFMFIKAVPSVKSDQSPTGRSYDNNGAITFKLEAEKALGLSFALIQYANGKGKAYDEGFGSFQIFADTSKSQYGGSGGSKKSMTVKMDVNSKTNKAVINMLFSQEGSKPVAFYLTPYESYSLGTIIEFVSIKCIEYEMNGPGIVVKKQFQAKSQPKTDVFGGPGSPTNNNTFKSTPNDIKGIEKVTGGFGGMFNSDNPFGD
jgi:hypothetical protein